VEARWANWRGFARRFLTVAVPKVEELPNPDLGPLPLVAVLKVEELPNPDLGPLPLVAAR